MGKDILHRVGNGGHCGCEAVSREVLPQVEIPEKWTQEPPCFAITIGVRLRSHINQYISGSNRIQIWKHLGCHWSFTPLLHYKINVEYTFNIGCFQIVYR